jgi:hypothetical protein
MPVLDLAGSAVHHHQTGIFSFLGRVLRNKVKGKVKTELG